MTNQQKAEAAYSAFLQAQQAAVAAHKAYAAEGIAGVQMGDSKDFVFSAAGMAYNAARMKMLEKEKAYRLARTLALGKDTWDAWDAYHGADKGSSYATATGDLTGIVYSVPPPRDPADKTVIGGKEYVADSGPGFTYLHESVFEEPTPPKLSLWDKIVAFFTRIFS